MKALLVYTTGNKIHRRVVMDTNDPTAQSLVAGHVQSGESFIIVDQSELVGTHPHDVLIARGIQPAHSGRLVPVDALGNVGAPILGDHEMPDVQDKIVSLGAARLIQHDTADIGWMWKVDTGFIPPAPGLGTVKVSGIEPGPTV